MGGVTGVMGGTVMADVTGVTASVTGVRAGVVMDGDTNMMAGVMM